MNVGPEVSKLEMPLTTICKYTATYAIVKGCRAHRRLGYGLNTFCVV